MSNLGSWLSNLWTRDLKMGLVDVKVLLIRILV